MAKCLGDALCAVPLSRIQALEKAAQDFDEWRPGVDGIIDDLKIEVGKLSTLKLEVSKITKYWERSMVDSATPAPGVFVTAPPSPVATISDHKSASPHEPKPVLGGDFLAALRPSAGFVAKRPDGHRRSHGSDQASVSYRRMDVMPGQKPAWQAPLPLPPPPPKLAIADAPRVTEVTTSTAEEKFRSLRARGLCIRCGAKWSREHKCSEVVQLHLVQELLDMFPYSDDAETSSPPSPAALQVMMHLSVAAISGASAPKTLCLTGSIQGISLSILVDSGSSHTFLSSSLAQSLSGIQELRPTVSVQVANGAVLQCTSHIPAAVWFVQGCTFTHDLKLLPLSSFDMILGLDWLASFSPMQVHWAQKWLSIPYQGSTTVLVGDAPELPVGSVIQLCVLQEDNNTVSQHLFHAKHRMKKQADQHRSERNFAVGDLQVLVKWNNLPPSLATWEDYEALRQELPRAAAWGQAAFQGRGSVSSVPAQAATSPSGDDPATSQPRERPKAQRPKKANMKYFGDEWAG
ncbi:unnamed protein product [Miscanthus lutarioriparius]|uniref:Chromo domain-containing protein n=1 Tax=Miscanthus lutarioriparius TaxID=422564 RepID=A0A811PY89_9POAL|nr:unnamed protein product [Miscanthus lutarioriparius]